MRLAPSSTSDTSSPVLTQKPVVRGTLALLSTYLLCKEADMARQGCLLFCQLLQFYCYHIGAITFALRSIFCIFVHLGWAHILPTWTVMAQTYKTNISVCLVSGVSDSHRDTKAGMILSADSRKNTAFCSAWVLLIWTIVNSRLIFPLL